MIGVLSWPQSATSIADRVTLKDGTVVLGQLVSASDRGKVVVVVRRAWADEHLPEKAKAWRDFEAPYRKRATDERIQRLREWRNDRAGRVGGEDPLLRQIDDAIRNAETAGAEEPTLLMVPLERRDVAKVEPRPAREQRLLRLAWRSGFADPEAMSVEDALAGLEARGFAANGEDPGDLSSLLPTPIETDAEWSLRRACAELKAERTGWFVRYGDSILPDAGPGAQAAGANPLAALGGGGLGGLSALGGMGELKSLLRELNLDAGVEPPPDPWPGKLADLAGKGRSGAIVTKLEIAPDLAGVTVTSELWVHVGPGAADWKPAGSRTATVRTDEVAAGAGEALAANPQIEQALDLADSLGLGQIDPQLKQRALGVGAATQQALSKVREQAQADLDRLAVPLER
jgi:hypothetical protein